MSNGSAGCPCTWHRSLALQSQKHSNANDASHSPVQQTPCKGKICAFQIVEVAIKSSFCFDARQYPRTEGTRAELVTHKLPASTTCSASIRIGTWHHVCPSEACRWRIGLLYQLLCRLDQSSALQPPVLLSQWPLQSMFGNAASQARHERLCSLPSNLWVFPQSV